MAEQIAELERMVTPKYPRSGMLFTIRHLELWDAGGKPEEWHVVKTFPLGI